MAEQYTITLPTNGPTKAQWVNIICDAEDYESNKTYPILDAQGNPVLDQDGNPTEGTYTKAKFALRKLHQLNMNYLRKKHLSFLEKQASISSTFDLDGEAV